VSEGMRHWLLCGNQGRWVLVWLMSMLVGRAPVALAFLDGAASSLSDQEPM